MANDIVAGERQPDLVVAALGEDELAPGEDDGSFEQDDL